MARRGRRSSSCAAARRRRATTHLLKRGDFLKPGKAVAAGVPAFLHPLPDASADADAADVRAVAGRPQVADDGAGVRQPRLAGVLRHRPRRHAARTSASQGETPSHPELLDWLAVEFMEQRLERSRRCTG